MATMTKIAVSKDKPDKMKRKDFEKELQRLGKSLLLPLIRHMDEQAGVGTISEIFDGDEPHRPRGCIAQAWSVAEVLRCWHELHAPPPNKPSMHMGGHNGSH